MINKKNLVKKIIYRSSHRGTKEMDILLGKFVNKNIEKFNINELKDLINLLELEDSILQKLILKKKYSNIIPHNRVSKMLKAFKM